MHISETILEQWRLGRIELPWDPNKDLIGLDCLEIYSEELDCFESWIETWHDCTALRPK